MIGTSIAIIALAVYLIAFTPSAAAPAEDHIRQATEAQRAAAVDTNQITIQNYIFSPQDVRIKKGQTVIWTNADPSPHKIIVVVDGTKTASSTISSNGSFSFVFDKAGTFTYYDSDLPDEQGAIVVTEN